MRRPVVQWGSNSRSTDPDRPTTNCRCSLVGAQPPRSVDNAGPAVVARRRVNQTRIYIRAYGPRRCGKLTD